MTSFVLSDRLTVKPLKLNISTPCEIHRRFILTTNGKPHMGTRSPMVTWQMTSRGIKRSRSWPLYLWSVISQKPSETDGCFKFTTYSIESIYYKTYGHVTDDVTRRKWWLFKETHAARIPVRLPACLFIYQVSATDEHLLHIVNSANIIKCNFPSIRKSYKTIHIRLNCIQSAITHTLDDSLTIATK